MTKKQSLILDTTQDKQRVTLFFHPSLLTYSKAQAVLEGLSLTTLVEKALIQYLPEETVIKKAEIKTDFDS